ncbi:MAG: hypothetical protein KDK76_01930 [Chlamydiia bacterium]|nr:hypothetical protein [Chlamydiia bacterium]
MKSKKAVYFLLSLLVFPLLAFAHPQEEDQDLFSKDDAAFLMTGEYLYWTAHEGALDYAIRMRAAAWGPSDSFAQGDVERAEFKWENGYRFAIGYYRAPNFWEADFQWTYIHFEGNNRAKRPPANENRFITGTFPQIFPAPMDHATSHIYMHYKLADLIAHRIFHPFDNPHLRIKLLGGMTGVWLHQGWNIRYFDAQLNNTKIQNQWKFWGFGFRAGLSFDWFWGDDFYATGKMSTGLAVGHYQNHSKQETSVILQPGDHPNIPIRDLYYDDYRISYTAQFLLGPSYQKSFDTWRIELFVGYEMTIWSNLQEIFRSTRAPADQAKETWLSIGLVSLHGLTTRATINF